MLSDRESKFAMVARSILPASIVGLNVLEPNFNRTGQLNRQRVALAVERLAGRDPNPTFRKAVFLYVSFDLVAKAHTDTARKKRFIVVRALWIDAKAIWRRICHRSDLACCAARNKS